ncbi:DUF4190 domain-containing protein [Streptomyces sp. NPDC058664]|uniref:DUF4190 domain-containing protein n=1 Tax=unclassified Streptomyces TaxID=2593676 RepID=UPI0036461825
MSDNRDQSRDGYDPTDPWAPPNRDGVELSKPVTPSPVHDQQTVTSMPLTPDTGAVPPPPVAPGGPAATSGAYGYPAADTSGGYGYPTAPTPVTPAPGAPSGYGYPGYPSSYGSGYPGQSGYPQSPSNGMGTASMVLGIIAVAGFCLYGLGMVLGILALIFGVIGMKKAGRGEATNRGMALAGVILGAIGTVVSAVFLGFVIWAVTQDPSTFEDSGTDGDPFGSSLVVESGR